MRTVDPCLWSKKIKKQTLVLSGPNDFGVKRSKLEIRLRRSFKDAMQEFWKNSSVGGVSLVRNSRKGTSERWCYTLLLVVTVVIAIFVLVDSLDWYALGSPLVVNDLVRNRSQHDTTFPAVAICSHNVISAAALTSYAQYLYALDKNRTFSIDEIKQNLLAFSGVLTNTLMPINPHFIRFLGSLGHGTNVTRIMYKLGPRCSSLLARCGWRARRVRCARLFAARVTPLGFCCLFNSHYLPEDVNSTTYKLDEVGAPAGLRVVIRENAKDFGFTRRPGTDIQVLLFDGRQYPLPVAGGLRSYLVQLNTSVLYEIKKHSQYASTSLVYYANYKLGCRLAEGSERDSLDSWSKCLVRCQREAAIALCGCAPFFLPAADSKFVTECSLEHLSCLAKHREKFMYFDPGEAEDKSLGEESANSLECLGLSRCVPDCERHQYSATTSTLPLLMDHHSLKDEFLNGLELADTAVLQLFHTADTQRLTIFESYYEWYEGVAFIFCQVVCIVAVTIITCVELVYHCTVRWTHHYRRRHH